MWEGLHLTKEKKSQEAYKSQIWAVGNRGGEKAFLTVRWARPTMEKNILIYFGQVPKKLNLDKLIA